MKKLENIVRGLFVSAVAGSILLFTSCKTADHTESYNYFKRFARNISSSFEIQTTHMNIDIPEQYGDIPPHPNDPPSSVTKKVKLKSGHYWSMAFGLDVSPVPYKIIENLKFGYTATFPLNPNTIREGLSEMEWYQKGAYAGTYSRVEVPNTINSLRLSWRQPIGRSYFIEAGGSLDFWKINVQGGWDRYYSEEPMIEDSLKDRSINPFLRLGLANEKATLHLLIKGERIEGKVPYGDVELRGTTFGLGFSYKF